MSWAAQSPDFISLYTTVQKNRKPYHHTFLVLRTKLSILHPKWMEALDIQYQFPIKVGGIILWRHLCFLYSQRIEKNGLKKKQTKKPPQHTHTHNK